MYTLLVYTILKAPPSTVFVRQYFTKKTLTSLLINPRSLAVICPVILGSAPHPPRMQQPPSARDGASRGRICNRREPQYKLHAVGRRQSRQMACSRSHSSTQVVWKQCMHASSTPHFFAAGHLRQAHGARHLRSPVRHPECALQHEHLHHQLHVVHCRRCRRHVVPPRALRRGCSALHGHHYSCRRSPATSPSWQNLRRM